MSKFSEQREQETGSTAGPGWRWIVLVVVALAAVWAGYDYSSYRNAHKLDSFAKCTSSKGARMYGAWWCPHCAEQKQKFGEAFQYVNYVECSPEGQHTMNETCKQAGIQHFPTWQFPDGSRKEGAQPLSELSERTGCKLP